MVFSEKTKAYFIGGGSLIGILVLIFLIGEIIMPFVFAIFLSYLINPVVLKIQKKFKNRNLALTSLLLVSITLFISIVVFFGDHIIKDTRRLVDAVDIFVDQNEQEIKEIQTNAIDLFDELYASEIVQVQLQSVDTMTIEGQEKSLMSAFETVYSFFSAPSPKTKEPETDRWNWFIILIYTLIYTVVILYTYDYFESKYKKYFAGRKAINKNLQGIWDDFKKVFFDYFKQRVKVVLICMFIFVLTFSILNLPGAIIIGLLTGLLCSAGHFHYLSLPITAIGCWVLSIEHDLSFFLFFGIVLFVYIIVSVLEETVFFNKIMKSVSGMNPAITILAFILWISIFGGFIGTIIALPLTQLILIYLDRLLLYPSANTGSIIKEKPKKKTPVKTTKKTK